MLEYLVLIGIALVTIPLFIALVGFLSSNMVTLSEKIFLISIILGIMLLLTASILKDMEEKNALSTTASQTPKHIMENKAI